MRGPLIATLAAIATLSGCVQPQPHAPAAAPTSEASPTAAVPPAPPTTTPSPVEADKSRSPTPAPQAPPKETARNAPSNPPPAGRSTPNATPSPPKGSSTPAKPPPLAAAAAPAEPTASPTLDLDGLEQRLRDTHAIGVFTKLSLKNQVDDLLDQFRGFHEGKIKVALADLRQRYEQLLLEVITLLQDSDDQLANAVASSREAIWGILADPKAFAKI